MERAYAERIASELSLDPARVTAVVRLIDDDATVPFIARYRKEMTGSLDEVAIADIRDRIQRLRELDKRRTAILESLAERNLLSDELRSLIVGASVMAELEDLYLPYRPKRRTRAMIARERGLEPLAGLIFAQVGEDPYASAMSFIDPEKNIITVDDAIAGARDIMAEWLNEDAEARRKLRALFAEQGMLYSRVLTGKESDGAKYADYFEWQEPLASAPSHRILAMRRGETEGFLSLKIAPPEESALAILQEMFVIGSGADADQVRMAVNDAYKRLLAPAMETDLRAETKLRADKEAIRVFTANLRELLMVPPLGRKRIMAIDPGFRSGCKIVCLDRQGSLEHHTTIYPHTGEKARRDAAVEIKALCERFRTGVIAVGNGTAGRETIAFLKEIGLPDHISIDMVNESGASIYSASEVARREFPSHDVTVRGAVSIGRRLLDPLSELVKIEPKSIGVGQYQHDVDQTLLRSGLDDTVMSCVNAVGVEVNTASPELLTYVSGLGPSLAANIVAYRESNGPFGSRHDLTKVPRLGPKAFEQAAGFLRLRNSKNPLDRSAVHPERYPVVERMAKDLDCTVVQLMETEQLRMRIDLKKFVSGDIGLPTLQDILAELDRPGRDPRGDYEPFSFDDTIKSFDDLRVGMILPGIVTNVTAFGAFVDIGVHQDGLVHISEMADRFIKDPAEVVKPQQKVAVTVVSIDIERKRIGLSMRTARFK